MRVTALVVLAAGAVLVGKAEALQIERATNPQRLVAPSTYRKVPDSIRVKLQKHGCYLPATQAMDNGEEPINVVSGHFAGKDQLDWAAICVIRDRPQIFVLWGGRAPACSSEIHSGWPLKEKFSEEPAGGIFLRKATPQLMLNYRRAFPEGPNPPVTYDGLEVGDEQASLNFYGDGSQWLELRGND